MKASRRQALQLGLAGGAFAAIGGCSRLADRLNNIENGSAAPVDIDPSSRDAKILNRIGFGASNAVLAQLRDLGPESFLKAQSVGDMEEPLSLQLKLNQLDVLRVDGAELQELPQETVLQQLQQASALRAIYSPNQLRERMVDFWTNHFNIYARKAQGYYFKGRDDEIVVRKHALGRFPEMLFASAKSPAMLAYLDNTVNKKGIANENYARELLELHTLGVGGGYTQKDVQEVARCFTGWGMEKRFLRPYGKFRFDPERHDQGEKRVLGHVIPAGGGMEDGMQVLEILSNHPATANYVSKKLCQQFLGEAGKEVAPKVAKAYLASGGSIQEMLSTIFESDQLIDGPKIIKRPFDFVVSAIRETGADTDGRASIREVLRTMGQPLYEWPTPDGYPTKSSSWTSSILARWNFAWSLCNDELPGISMPSYVTDKMGIAARIASPAFQWR